VSRVQTADADVLPKAWSNSRAATYRGIRRRKSDFGAVAFGTSALVILGFEIARLFETGFAPVSPEETIKIFAFIEAADESQRQSGTLISLREVIIKARESLHQQSAVDFD
jgi:hypothetical protein